jgi:hypothetical protein
VNDIERLIECEVRLRACHPRWGATFEARQRERDAALAALRPPKPLTFWSPQFVAVVERTLLPGDNLVVAGTSGFRVRLAYGLDGRVRIDTAVPGRPLPPLPTGGVP